MAIDIVRLGRSVAPVAEKTKSKETGVEKTDGVDRVELSEKSKLLFAAEKAEKIGVIRAKVKNGFYGSRKVTEKVVEGIMKDLKNPPRV